MPEYPEFDLMPEETRKRFQQIEDRHHIEGRAFSEWWDEMHHKATTAANGQEFKQAVEQDHHILARGEGNCISLLSAAGSYGTVLNCSLTGARSDEDLAKFLSSINRAELPTTDEARQANDYERVREFWQLADKNAETYKSAIEGAGYVLANRDEKILVVTPAGAVDDLQRLTPAIANTGEDISDYQKFIAPIDVQKLPSVQEAQAIQAQKQGLDPELEALLRNLGARQGREALDLSDRQELQIHGDPPNWLTQRHLQEREKQNEQFAQERERYIGEYRDARSMLNEIRDRDKQEALERGDTLEEGPQKFSR